MLLNVLMYQTVYSFQDFWYDFFVNNITKSNDFNVVVDICLIKFN